MDGRGLFVLEGSDFKFPSRLPHTPYPVSQIVHPGKDHRNQQRVEDRPACKREHSQCGGKRNEADRYARTAAAQEADSGGAASDIGKNEGGVGESDQRGYRECSAAVERQYQGEAER